MVNHPNRSNGARRRRCHAIEAALRELLDWAREHTSPRDANSPHEILIRAAAALQPDAGK